MAQRQSPPIDPRLGVECFDCGHRPIGGVIVTETLRVPPDFLIKSGLPPVIQWSLCGYCAAKAALIHAEQRHGEEQDRLAREAKAAEEAAA